VNISKGLLMSNQWLEITTDIILIDVVGYSLMSNEEQLHTAEIINTSLSKQIHFMAELANLRKEEVVLGFIPTGDGMYILLNPQVYGYGILLGLSIRNYLLWTSSELLNGLYKGVRAGIHIGTLLSFTDVNGCRNYVGSGLNDCARLLSVKNEDAITFCGDTNYIVASESAYFWFLKLFTGKDAKEFLSTMRVKVSDQFQITDKHKKVHNARLIDASRYVEVQPPNFVRSYKR
jgi:hypothetical protein